MGWRSPQSGPREGIRPLPQIIAGPSVSEAESPVWPSQAAALGGAGGCGWGLRETSSPSTSSSRAWCPHRGGLRAWAVRPSRHQGCPVRLPQTLGGSGNLEGALEMGPSRSAFTGETEAHRECRTCPRPHREPSHSLEAQCSPPHSAHMPLALRGAHSARLQPQGLYPETQHRSL